MGMFETAKKVARALGVTAAAGRVAAGCAKVFPHQRCRRGDILWNLDLTRTIDYGIYLGGWEPETIGFLKSNLRSGDVVVEVGANIGAHALPIADIVGASGHVFCFEAAPYALSKLRMNIELNPKLAEVITVVDKLVTNNYDNVPVMNLRSAWKRDGSNELAEPVLVRSTSIDKFLTEIGAERLDLLKIDVDGYDFKVLSGAEGSIDKFRPVVLIELAEYCLNQQGDSVRDIFQFFDARGYQSFYDDGRPLSGVEEALRVVGTTTSINGWFKPPGS